MTTSTDGNDDAPNENDSVGVIGTGRAGRWFVTKLCRSGYDPVVHDADPEAVEAAVERGGTAVDTPAAVAHQSSIVVLCLPTREAVHSVMDGDDGVLATLEAGQVVVDAGTMPPDVATHYQPACREHDAGYVDCGMTRQGPGEADDPSEPVYTMFVGGEREDYDRATGVIEALSHDHEFFEGVGNGHLVKAAVVLRATCRAAVAAEVSEFLSTNAIDPERVVDLLEWEVPEPYLDPPYFTNRGFERAVGDGEEHDEGDHDRRDHDEGDHEGDAHGRGESVDESDAGSQRQPSAWAKDPAYALAAARASNSYVPMLTAATQTMTLAENYGSAVVDRDLAFGDPEWHLFHLRSVYRALTRPQEEWRRLDRWTEPQDREE